MRVLIVHSPYLAPELEIERTERLGILYLAASTRQAGHIVEIYDPTIAPPIKTQKGYYYGRSEDEMRKAIELFHPDVVGISVHQEADLQGMDLIAKLAKQVTLGNAVTIAGGVYPSVHKETVLKKCNNLDYAMQGESEISFNMFLNALESGTLDAVGIDGLLWRNDKGIIINPKKVFVDNPDSIPYPARDLVDIKRYMNNKLSIYGLGSRPSLSLLTSRSCLNKCNYCNMWMIHGAKWRPRSPENVLEEVDEMVLKYGAGDIFIMDDNFTLKKERVMKICEGLIQRNYGIRWNTPNGISAKGIDVEIAKAMKAAGCASVCIAVETGNETFRKTVLRKKI